MAQTPSAFGTLVATLKSLFTPSRTVSPTSSTITTVESTITPKQSIPASGYAQTVSADTVVPSCNAAPTGVPIVTNEGSATPARTSTTVGAAITTIEGTVTPKQSVGSTGVPVSQIAGSTTPSVTVIPVGASSSFQVDANEIVQSLVGNISSLAVRIANEFNSISTPLVLPFPEGTTVNLDFSAPVTNYAIATLTHNTVIAFSNAKRGHKVTLRLFGNYTAIAWLTAFHRPYWVTGTLYPNKVYYAEIICIDDTPGSEWFWFGESGIEA